MWNFQITNVWNFPNCEFMQFSELQIVEIFQIRNSRFRNFLKWKFSEFSELQILEISQIANFRNFPIRNFCNSPNWKFLNYQNFNFFEFVKLIMFGIFSNLSNLSTICASESSRRRKTRVWTSSNTSIKFIVQTFPTFNQQLQQPRAIIALQLL